MTEDTAYYRAIDTIAQTRRDAESPERDKLEGISMLRTWLRGLHMRVEIGHTAAQALTQDQIAERLGECPRGHPRAFLVK